MFSVGMSHGIGKDSDVISPIAPVPNSIKLKQLSNQPMVILFEVAKNNIIDNVHSCTDE